MERTPATSLSRSRMLAIPRPRPFIASSTSNPVPESRTVRWILSDVQASDTGSAENRYRFTGFWRAFVGGQDDAPAFVPRTHQLEENRGSQIVQRQIAHFVDHQNFRRQVHAHPAIQPPFAIRAPQVRCQIVRGDEIRSQSRADRLLRQRHTQVRFSHARWTQENHVAGFVNESQRTQLPNLPLIQRWLKTEIELLEGLYEREMR